eukprot:184537-Pleurochrysis_carterae.AAC.1
MSTEFPVHGAPRAVYSLFFSSLSRRQKAKFLVRVPDALDRAHEGDIWMGQNLYRRALGVAVVAGKKHSAALHGLLELFQ